jgi:hypothetical protein
MSTAFSVEPLNLISFYQEADPIEFEEVNPFADIFAEESWN